MSPSSKYLTAALNPYVIMNAMASVLVLHTCIIR